MKPSTNYVNICREILPKRTLRNVRNFMMFRQTRYGEIQFFHLYTAQRDTCSALIEFTITYHKIQRNLCNGVRVSFDFFCWIQIVKERRLPRKLAMSFQFNRLSDKEMVKNIHHAQWGIVFIFQIFEQIKCSGDKKFRR